jgi:transposase-like protein
MKCPKCKGKDISKRGKRYNKSIIKQLYLCNNCHKKFVEDDGFKRMRFKKEIIVKAIHQHIDGFSLFKVQYHLWQHEGIKVTRETINRWTKKYSNFLKSYTSTNSAKVKGKIAS